jgi:hypothetical protein
MKKTITLKHGLGTPTTGGYVGWMGKSPDAGSLSACATSWYSAVPRCEMPKSPEEVWKWRVWMSLVKDLILSLWNESIRGQFCPQMVGYIPFLAGSNLQVTFGLCFCGHGTLYMSVYFSKAVEGSRMQLSVLFRRMMNKCSHGSGTLWEPNVN